MELNVITSNASFPDASPYGDISAFLTAIVLGLLILATIIGESYSEIYIHKMCRNQEDIDL